MPVCISSRFSWVSVLSGPDLQASNVKIVKTASNAITDVRWRVVKYGRIVQILTSAPTAAAASAKMASTPEMTATAVETASTMVAAVPEGMSVKMMPAVIAAADEDIVIGAVVAVIRPAIRAGITIVVIRPAVPGVIPVQVCRAGATSQDEHGKAHDCQDRQPQTATAIIKAMDEPGHKSTMPSNPEPEYFFHCRPLL